MAAEPAGQVVRAKLRPRAALELATAREWYAAQRAGLGTEFVNAFDRMITALLAHPQRAPLVRDSIRRAMMLRFPFGIFYSLEGNVLVILAIVHARRDPQDWPHGQGK